MKLKKATRVMWTDDEDKKLISIIKTLGVQADTLLENGSHSLQ